MGGIRPSSSLKHPAEEPGQGELTFAALLRRFRLETGLSQEALAEQAGLHAETVGALERGLSHTPQRETVRLLAEALGLTVEERMILEAAIVRRRGARPADPPPSSLASTTAPFVFVAHARDDSAFVVRLQADLASHSITSWTDRAGHRPGSAAWEGALRTAIRACGAVLLVASPDARPSRLVAMELAVAEMYGRPVVPLWSAGDRWLDCVPAALSDAPYIDARGPRYPEAVAEMAATVGGLAVGAPGGESGRVVERGATARNPYKGLHAFTEEDAGDFFGRAALIEALLEAVWATVAPGQAPPARLLAVVGPSGSGKSSVIRAGLIPRLKAGALPGSEEWVYLEPMVPGSHPLEALAVALAGTLDSSMRTLVEDLNADSARGLHLLAQRLASRPEARVVLVIDQFEELFTLTATEEERRQAIDVLLTAAAEPRGPLLVILTLRADFYDRPMAYPALGTVLESQSRSVLPMAVAELREAIERPAALPGVGLTFEHGLVGDLLFEVAGQAGAMPLLEFTLDQLVARREGHALTVAAYREVGGVRGALTKQAEATFAALPSEEHARLARALFLRLIDPGIAEQDITRRRAALRELTLPDARQTALMREVADAFVAARLLTTGEHAGLTTLEVSHEALIRAWDRLAGWLYEAREDIRLQQTISVDAAEWARRGRPEDNLYRGTVLQEAQAWAARNVPSAEDMSFLEAGVAAAQRREVVQREAQARELALVQQAVIANRRAATRLRVLAGVLALFLLVAAGLTVFAFKNASIASDSRATAVAERDRARANAVTAARAEAHAVAAGNAAVTALSRELALQAGTLLGSRPQLALLLSVEAARLHSTKDTEADLARVVDSNPRLLTFLTTQRSPVLSVAFSPQGTILAAGNGDGTVRLWDVARRRSLGPPLIGHSDFVNSVAFSPDGTILASGSNDGTVRLWNVTRRRPLGPPLSGQAGFVNSVAFSPDGKVLASGGTDTTIRLWDVANRQPLGPPLTGQAGFVNSLAFSPDGRTLASGSGDGTVRLWNVTRRRPLGPPLTGHTGAVHSVAFSPDGKVLALGGSNTTIRLWDVIRRQPVGSPLTGHTGAVHSVAFSPDGKTLVSSSADGTIRLWDMASWQPIGPPLTGQTAGVNAVTFSPDGKSLASGDDDGSIRLWDMTSTQPVGPPLTGHTGAVQSVAFSPDGTTLASGGADGTVRLWDVLRHRPLGPPLTGHTDVVNSVAFSPDGKILASGGGDGTVRLWDVSLHRPLGPPLTQRTGAVHSIAFSPDGKALVSGSDDGTIRFWDVARRRPLGPPLASHTAFVNSLAFSPNGSILAAGGDDATIRLWDVTLRQPVGPPFTGHLGLVTSVAFSPDGKTLASGSADDTIRLWDVAHRQPIGPPLTGHIGSVWSVAFSPDGDALASGGNDGTVRRWDVASGRPIGPPFTGHTALVNAVTFSPDGRTLASGSNDMTVRLWTIQPRQPLARHACAIANRNLTLQEWRQYFGDLPYHKTCANLP